jgi:protein involved in polysaccharide export with SLBB domain
MIVTTKRILSALGCLALVFQAGCSSSPGNPLGIFPEGQRLLPVTKEMRRAAPDPLPLPRELDKQLAPDFVVEPGDVLLVQPADLDSPIRIPGDQPVLPDGTIHLGKFGRVVVVGLTIEQIEKVVREQIAKQLKDAGAVNVRLVSRQSKVYYVLGEVNAPGAYPLQGRETVLDAILAAGGVNNRAALKKMTLSRPTPPDHCRVVIPICYEEIVQLGDTSTNYQIQAGDRIFVPTRCLSDMMHGTKGKNDCLPCGRAQVPCTAPGECSDLPGCSAWHSAPHP